MFFAPMDDEEDAAEVVVDICLCLCRRGLLAAAWSSRKRHTSGSIAMRNGEGLGDGKVLGMEEGRRVVRGYWCSNDVRGIVFLLFFVLMCFLFCFLLSRKKQKQTKK